MQTDTDTQERSTAEHSSPSHLTDPPVTISADKATQFPELPDGSPSFTKQLPSGAFTQTLALALVLQHQQAAGARACSDACAHALTEANSMRQMAAFERSARLRAQQEASSLRASHDATQAELGREKARLSAQEASAGQAEAAAQELLPVDKATQFPEPTDSSTSCTQQLPPAASMQSLALVLVLQHRQASILQAQADAQADASSMRQVASFEKRTRLRAQQEVLTLQALHEAAMQKMTADFAAQEAFARQADAAAKESAQLSCQNLYDMEAAVKSCSDLVRDMSELKVSYETSEAALQAANAQCAELNDQLQARQQEMARQGQWQATLQQQVNDERARRQWCENQAAFAAEENKKQVWQLQQQIQAASSQWQSACQKLQQDDGRLRADLNRCQASLTAERRAAEGSNQEVKQLRQQVQQLLSQQQAAAQKLQAEAAACKEDAARYRSEREQARYDLAQLAEAKAAADQTIAAHWKAGAAKDAAIKDTSMKLASAIAQASVIHNPDLQFRREDGHVNLVLCLPQSGLLNHRLMSLGKKRPAFRLTALDPSICDIKPAICRGPCCPSIVWPHFA